MAILQTIDFIGEYSVPQNAFSDLGIYIDKYEKIYLRKILGVELYDLFIADLTPTTPQVPQTPIYETIFEPIAINLNGIEIVSAGLKDILTQFIYFHYMREHRYQKTMSGVNSQASENGIDLGYNGFNLIDSYNYAVSNVNAVQCFINENLVDYPTYNGYHFLYLSGY
jgi:hypothetical protein